MKLQSFRDLYDQLLSQAYAMEKKNHVLFPKVIEKVHSPELKQALTTYYSNLKHQHPKWEKFMEENQMKINKAQFCPTDALIAHLETVMKENPSSLLLDAVIIYNLQQIEHIGMATFGTLKAFCQQMSEPAHKTWFQNITREEMRLDSLLSKLAIGEMGKKGINQKAA